MLCNGWGRLRQAGVSVALVLATSLGGLLAVCPGTAQAKGFAGSPAAGQADTVTLAQLPPQGRSMLTLIYQGGPFRHDKDGVVFGNRERLLPAGMRGYYHEYTVRTPGVRHRGARRIVCGGLQPAAPEACYYSDDHYASFRKIVP